MLKALIVSLALPALALAQEPAKPEAAAAAAPAAVQVELKVGTAVENKNITGDAAEFKVAADTKLYLWARVTGAAADSAVTLSFWKGDKEVYKKELKVGGSPYRLHVYKTFRAHDGGDWTAKALGPDGAELAKADFKVAIE